LVRAHRRSGRRVPGRRAGWRARLPQHPLARHAQRRRHDAGAHLARRDRRRHGRRLPAARAPPAALAAGTSRARVRRWIWLAGGVFIAGRLLALFASRLLGRRGSRPATLLSVVTGWLGAWVLWSFAGGLATRHGLLETYDGSLFALVAVGGGL